MKTNRLLALLTALLILLTSSACSMLASRFAEYAIEPVAEAETQAPQSPQPTEKTSPTEPDTRYNSTGEIRADGKLSPDFDIEDEAPPLEGVPAIAAGSESPPGQPPQQGRTAPQDSEAPPQGSSAPPQESDAPPQESNTPPQQNNTPPQQSPERPPYVPVTSVVLDKIVVAMARGERITLHTTVQPADATNARVLYSSSDQGVAIVYADGTIYAIGAGTTIISCTADGVSSYCHVTVTVPVTSISVSADRRVYMVGDECSFTVRILPDDATDKTYGISVSGAAKELDGEGRVNCEAGGEIVITATAKNGVSGSVTVRVVDLHEFASEVFRLTNAERSKAGLPALVQTAALTATAYQRALEAIEYFSHTRPDGSDCFTAFAENGVVYSRAAENIAYGQTTPAEVVAGWMASPGHKENIVDPNLGKLGVGVAMDANGRIYWAQSFTD
ncbi:MAG: CAP domain-containing protein [Oscillospiraceae bacterium]|nr:CAP domain-containing protein [Oscillospiraceae bacterium]